MDTNTYTHKDKVCGIYTAVAWQLLLLATELFLYCLHIDGWTDRRTDGQTESLVTEPVRPKDYLLMVILLLMQHVFQLGLF